MDSGEGGHHYAEAVSRREVSTPLADDPSLSPVERPVPRPSLVAGLLRTARPKQWVKNVLVFAAPGAAGVLTQQSALLRTLLAFALFCAAASGVYFLNDAFDRVADSLHPKKRFRPVAAGIVPVGLAKGVGGALLAMAIGVALMLNHPRLGLVLGVYTAVSIAYSLYLKKEPVLDMGAVASGFVLRSVGGAVAAGVPVSHWFLIVASFGSLFMVAGKRHAEHVELGDGRAGHRVTLGLYSSAYLRYVRSVTSAVTITSYCLWAFEKATAAGGGIWFELSIVPFVLAIFRYGLLLDAGEGGAPEDVVLRDRALLGLAMAWLAIFVAGTYAI